MIKFKLLPVLLLLMIFCSINLFAAANTGMLVQDSETYTIDMLDGNVTNTTVEHLIGVGLDTAKKKSFDVTLIKKLPQNSRTSLRSKDIISVKDLNKKPFSIPYRQILNLKDQEFEFILKNVPTVNLKSTGQCCGCDGSCGTACGVEFTYQVYDKPNPFESAKVISKVDTKELKPGIDNKISIDLAVETKNIEKLTVALTLPENDPKAVYKFMAAPPGFIRKTLKNAIIFSQSLSKGKRNFYFVISIKPRRTGELITKGLLKITGISSKMKYQKIIPKNWQVSKQTRVKNVNFNLDYKFKISP